MLTLTDNFITLLALAVLAAFILSQIELWQRKEYRWDRLRTGLLSAELRPRLYPFALAVILTLFGAIPAALLTLFAYHVWRISARGLYRPCFTLKASLLVFITVVLAGLIFILLLTYGFVTSTAWLGTILLVPPLTALAVIITNSLATARKLHIIKRAGALRQSLPDLTVVGITGSFGKTSTKHFLSQLIPQATATKEHRNSEFPLAQDMLGQLTSHISTYIVEMGAYARGEIAALAKLTRPQIGVITAIGNQHLATFGSPENILKTKWELIQALPPNGIAILNADDLRLRAAAGSTPAKKIIWFSTTKPADIYADNITTSPRSISAQLHIINNAHLVTIPLAGPGALSSVLAAVAAAHAVGESDASIVSRLQRLTPYPQTMQITTTASGLTIIDDSYTANEQGVINAIEHLKRFPDSDKRIVLVPLIELGKQAQAVHQRIGQALNQSGARVYIYGTAFKNQLGQNQSKPVYFFTDPQELAASLTKNLTNHTVILLEGRVPDLKLHSL